MLGQLRRFPVAARQILVTVRASGMNFTDVEQVRGKAAGLCRGYQATIVRRFFPYFG
jgi:NADPH:quinone reductase-like Zn-dependent oxidoreductase